MRALSLVRLPGDAVPGRYTYADFVMQISYAQLEF